MVSPPSIVDIDINTLQRTLVKQKTIPNYEPSLYKTKRVWATSPDNKSIPMSMVYSTASNASNASPSPVLLYAYGSYGMCMEPSFNAKILPLLDRGVVFCIAHVRGGSEMGYHSWYAEGGKYLSKKNTFDDFITCAEFLVGEGYTTPELLALEGRSAGGLLVGAVVNKRPDLFRVGLAGVPFVDVLTTMADPSIPLTVGEWEEWGNPNNEGYYEYMKSYSPIDNVRDGVYPALLVTAGLHDPRVAYWEPAKWVATLREHHNSDRPILLKIDLESGHFSASDRYKYIKEKAFEYAFLLEQLGVLDEGVGVGEGEGDDNSGERK